MKCLILGGAGQVGRALAADAPEDVEIAAPPRADCDITDSAQLKLWFEDVRPHLVINAAGYTDVNGAESHGSEARAVNAQGPATLAALCRQRGSRLIHLSTDYVFDGTSRTPYTAESAANPLNEYGRTKYAGEELVRRENPDAIIVRTAWLYAGQGRNFVNTMLDLMAERDAIKVVADQTGTPTYARNLARALWRLASVAASETFHFTDEGQTSRHGFALAIRDEARAVGLITRNPDIIAVATCDYSTPARRPAYSVLDKSKIWAKIGTGEYWRSALADMLRNKKRNG